MSHGRPGRPMGPHYCDGCFIECARLSKTYRSGGYPCNPELREWAREHRDDPGDAMGYVFERTGREGRRAATP